MSRFDRTKMCLLVKYNSTHIEQINVVSRADNRTARFSHTGDIESAFGDPDFKRNWVHTSRCNRLHSYIEASPTGGCHVLYLDFFKSDDLFEW
jgi:hypothetical protein